MNDFNFKDFGKGVRFYREKAGITEETLAEILPTSQSYLSDLENGKAHPSVKKIVDICNALNISVCSCMKQDKGENRVLYHQFKRQLIDLDEDTKLLYLKVLNMLNEIEG